MILDEIVAKRKEQLAREKERLSVEVVKKQAFMAERPTSDFYQVLKKKPISIIAEVKKASPSKGIINETFDYKTIAKNYERAGAAAISVLTEEHYFKGSSNYLKEIREIVNVPILRKDFIVDPYQIYEARVLGADAILLIASLLDKQTLKKFLSLAQDIGLAALVEVHNQEELEKALACQASIIGINNRNLKTFEVDLNTTKVLASKVPKECVIVSESGILKPQDAWFLKECGIDALLIGEMLMRSQDVKETIRCLKEGMAYERGC